MDKRKKLVKLFGEIELFIKQKSVKSDPYLFLINKFYLSLTRKRPAANTLIGMTKNSFSILNNQFADRLTRDFVQSLSMTAILSLPSPEIIEFSNLKLAPKSTLLLLTDKVAIPYEIEKKIQIFIGYGAFKAHVDPFQNVEYSPISRESPYSVSLQSTLFDFISEGDISSRLKPNSFDAVIDDASRSSFPTRNLLDTISVFLKPKGIFYLIVKKIFFSTPSTKKEKSSLYSLFVPEEIYRLDAFLQLKLLKKSEGYIRQSSNVTFRDLSVGKTMKIEIGQLDFNHLLTFNDNIGAEQRDVAAKIEKTGATCGDYFKFFLGMFRRGGLKPPAEPFRKGARYKPLVVSKDITPYETPLVKQYVFPDEKYFFQIPSDENFRQKKLLMKYLSVKPIFAYDEDSLYFLNDVAAVFPKQEGVDLFFAEGFLNSKLVKYYYSIKFPHHNKFLKKNFNKIPFLLCAKNIQKIISDLVKEIRNCKKEVVKRGETEELKNKISGALNILDGFIYQLFKLSPEEVETIESFFEKHL